MNAHLTAHDTTGHPIYVGDYVTNNRTGAPGEVLDVTQAANGAFLVHVRWTAVGDKGVLSGDMVTVTRMTGELVGVTADGQGMGEPDAATQDMLAAKEAAFWSAQAEAADEDPSTRVDELRMDEGYHEVPAQEHDALVAARRSNLYGDTRPAAHGLPVKEGHTAWCAEHGHATPDADMDQGLCPRCGVVTVPADMTRPLTPWCTADEPCNRRACDACYRAHGGDPVAVPAADSIPRDTGVRIYSHHWAGGAVWTHAYTTTLPYADKLTGTMLQGVRVILTGELLTVTASSLERATVPSSDVARVRVAAGIFLEKNHGNLYVSVWDEGEHHSTIRSTALVAARVYGLELGGYVGPEHYRDADGFSRTAKRFTAVQM